MEIIFEIFFFILILLNIYSTLGNSIKEVYPRSIQLTEDTKMTMSITFQEPLNNEVKELVLSYEYGTKNFSIKKIRDNPDNPNLTYFNFDRGNFSSMKYDYGNYFANLGNFRFPEPILIYKNIIELKNPTSRYFLTGSGKVNVSFDFKYEITKEQINRISLYDNSNNLVTNNCSYSLEKGLELVIININKFDSVQTYNYRIYPTIDKNTNNPLELNIYFQDFFVYNEAVYLKNSSVQSDSFFRIKFRESRIDTNQFWLQYSGDGSVVIKKKNFTEINNEIYFYFTITSQPYPGRILINYKGQIRPIFLITYYINDRRCYLSNSDETIEIFFYKTNEMEYPMSIYLNSTEDEDNIFSSDSNYKSYKIEVTTLFSHLYYLYSIIPKLSSNEKNFIDYPSLSIRVYKNPNLEENVQNNLYIGIKKQQFLNFSMEGAGNVHNIFLIGENKKNISLDLNNCKQSNKKYSCNLTDFLQNLDESYLSEYSVEYESECDKQRLKINKKIIKIERGIILTKINPKYLFVDDIGNTNISLTYSMAPGNNINISFCDSDYTTNCKNQIVYPSNSQTVRIGLKNLETTTKIYYIKTIANGQIIQNDTIKFKVLEKLDFNFSHNYFVKNNNGQKNYLNITKNFNLENNGICNITDQKGYYLEQTNCKYFIYDIYKVEQPGFDISFNYLDKDINEFIPIAKKINIVNDINILMDVNRIKSCYFYNFILSVQRYSEYNFNEKIFLVVNNKELEFKYISNNEYNLTKEAQEEIYNLKGKDLELYISEGYRDKEVYLYKSIIMITDISVPEYVVHPGKFLYFSDVHCDLSSSKFDMIYDNIFESIRQYSYSKNNLTLTGSFYQTYNKHYYMIDGKNVTNMSNSAKPLLYTFTSNRLDYSRFVINVDGESNKTHLKINITNNPKDFYFKLISNLTLYIIINGQNNSKFLDRNSKTNDFIIDDEKGQITFSIEKGNYDLDINHITRKVNSWEDIETNSNFHFFDYVYKNNIFNVEPKIFASHNFTEENLVINISFVNKELKNRNYKYIEKICTSINNKTTEIVECTLDKSNLKNEAKKHLLNISNYSISIDLIYYTLNTKSKCITLEEQNKNIDLIIYVPDESYFNEIYVKSDAKSFNQGKIDSTKKSISFTLDINNYETDKYYINFNSRVIRTFSLKDFGINFLPKYEFKERGNIFNLLPQQNQTIILNYEGNNPYNISKFKIGNIESLKLGKNFDQNNINTTFNLSNLYTVENKDKNNFSLNYIDDCGTEIKTGIIIQIISFNFKRHYFVINNNNDEQDDQYLLISGPNNNKIRLFGYNENNRNNPDIIMFDDKEGKYKYTFDDIGNYSFYYDNNGVKNDIIDKVYVFRELSNLFVNNTNLNKCMFYNMSNYLFFSYKFIAQNKYESVFNMTLKIKNDNTNYSLVALTNSSSQSIVNFLFYKTINREIPKNEELLIYFYENNDMAQPLYLYKYQYTTIILNSKYQDVIYSDAMYILFNMSCKIDNLQDFYLYNDSPNPDFSGTIKCNSFEETKFENVYNCSLDKINKTNNPFVDNNFNYGYYIMKYDSFDIVTKKFYISREINTSVFNLEKEDDIHPQRETHLKLNSTNNMFYIPYLENLTFLNSSTKNDNSPNINKIISIDFKNEFNKTNNYYEFTLYIGNKYNYYNLSKICRKSCDYCRYSDCVEFENRQDYYIKSNIPEIFLNFNRHYISLSDSLYNGRKNSTLIFNASGDDEDINLLKQIKYYFYDNDINAPKSETIINNINGNKILTNLEFGVYKFNFIANVGNKDKEIDKNYLIFVVNHDYEMFNINDLKYSCIYYDQNKEILFSTLTINESYIFNQIAKNALNDLQIYFGYSAFNYINESYGYELHNNQFLDCGRGNEYNFSLIEKNEVPNYVFTQFPSKKKCTDLNFVDNLYKDNIVLLDQSCLLENIYLKEELIENPEIKLNCYLNETEEISYCNINQKTFDRPNIIFKICFKYGNKFLYTEYKRNIYNAINDSNFDIIFREKERRLSIISSNFNMMNISNVEIDGQIYNINDKHLIDNISFYQFDYSLPNDSLRHNLTRLYRKSIDYDRSETIKHKDLNIHIIELECPEFLYPYQSLCLECSLLSKLNIFSGLKWYQGGQCVKECDNEKGYSIYDQENFYCRICEERTEIKDLNSGKIISYCSCLFGTVKSFKDNKCYLPEVEEITKLTDQQLSAQCYQADGVTHNYCNKNNTNRCTVENIKGYFFPICICEKGYTGKYCEFGENKINLVENLDYILSNDNIINEENITLISKIRGITHFLEIEDSIYINQFNQSQISDYINSTIKICEAIKKGRETVPQIFDVIELAIYFLNYRINNQKDLRNLEEEINDKEKLEYILDNLHYIYVQAHMNTVHNFKIQSDKLNLTTFIAYKINDLRSEAFKKEMTNMNFFRIMEYIDLNVEDDDLIFVTLINNSLFDNKENDFGVVAYFSTSKDINNTDTLSNKTNITFYISSSMINFNFHLAEYYNSKNIEIYNKSHEAFVEPCFLSENFEFDLTQKYRKNHIYQKINYGNEICKFLKFEYDYMRLIFHCQNFSYVNKTNDKLYYGMLKFNIKKDNIEDANKVYNLPTKCTKKIKSVGNNWAFWFFFILCIIEILYCIGIGILTFGSLKNISYRKGMVLDEFDKVIHYYPDSNNYEDFIPDNSQAAKMKEKYYEKASVGTKDLNNSNNSDIYTDKIFDKSFAACLIHNFRELHPLATLCRVSVISPLLLNSILFLFNTLILFGFNALLYYESLIEKRIYDKKRNNFDYPMRKEFHKIILSILCQIALCIIVKLILLVTLKQKIDFTVSLKNCEKDKHNRISNTIIIKIEQFQDEMFLRRIISSGVMVILIIFFFYYSVAFCGVYIQTQKNWFYSGIWSLFWNWVIFAPIYIVIISVLEYKKHVIDDPVIYYMKRLFCF